MPVLTTIVTALTLANLVECIINGSFENAPAVALKGIPKLTARLKKQFGDAKPEVNGHLQKAILSAHWMATIVFVEQMHKKGLLKDSYNNVNETIKKELKEIKNENYHSEENSPDVYDVTSLIKLPKEENVIEKLEADLLDFHLKLLDKKTGDVKKQEDYKKLKDFIQNGWKDENLNWFQLMTAFLNQLLKGDNNKAKDAFQNQTLAEINLKLDEYAEKCIQGIGEKEFGEYKVLLKQEIRALNSKLCEIHLDVISTKQTSEATFTKVEHIQEDIIEIKNSLGNSRQLNLNVFGQYNALSSEIEALKIKIAKTEEEMSETLEFIKDEENLKKKSRFERDYASFEEIRLKKFYEIEQKQNDLKEFTSNIEKTWLSVYSENSPRLSEARAALETGELDRANTILSHDAMQEDFEQLGKLDSITLRKKESLAQEFISKANLVITQKSTKDWFVLADEYYAKSAFLSKSFSSQSIYAYFLLDHHLIKRAVKQSENALSYASNGFEKAEMLNNLAVSLRKNNEIEKAEFFFKEAIGIHGKLTTQNSKIHMLNFAKTLNNYGSLLGEVKYDFFNAEKYYKQSLKIKRRLEKDSPQACLPELANTLNNWGILLVKNNKLDSAERRYKESLKIYKKLSKENPQIYLKFVGGTFNNLGNLEQAKKNMAEAEKHYNESLKIKRKLAKENPWAYLSDLAKTLNNLATLQIIIGELDKSENNLVESLDIRRKLARESPKAYFLIVASTLSNLAFLQKQKQDLINAEKNYIEAIDLLRKFGKEKGNVFQSNLAKTLNNLGDLQNAKNEMKNAEKSYKESLKIFRILADENPEVYSSEVAGVLNNLGNLQIDKHELTLSEKSFMEALEITRKLAEVNPLRFSIDYATTAINLAIFHRYNKPNREKSIAFAKLAIQYFSPFSSQVHFAAVWQKRAEELLEDWNNE